MILDKILPKKAGHTRGPPQQTYYLGSILLMKKIETIEIKISSDNSWTQQRTTTTNILLIMKKVKKISNKKTEKMNY
jgi:hypothetical protein